MHDCDLTVSPYNGHMLRNLRKRYLFICCKQSSSTHFCHYLTTAFVTDVLAGSNPMHRAQAKTVPLRGPFPILWWAMRDVRVRLAPPASRFVAPLLARCAGKRLRVSSAPHPGGFESHALGPNKNGPLARTVSNSVVGDEGCPRAASPPASAAALRALRAALENAYAFPQLRTLAGSNPMHWALTRKAAITGSLFNQVVGDEGFEPPALCV